MVLKSLFDMNELHDCKSNEQAIELFKKLREKIGDSFTRYRDTELLSSRQFATYRNALKYIKEQDYVNAIREVYDFLDNYGNNNHLLTNAEYAVLDCILNMI